MNEIFFIFLKSVYDIHIQMMFPTPVGISDEYYVVNILDRDEQKAIELFDSEQITVWSESPQMVIDEMTKGKNYAFRCTLDEVRVVKAHFEPPFPPEV